MRERPISKRRAKSMARDIIAGLIQNYLDVGAPYEEFGDDEESALKLSDEMERWQDYFGKGAAYPTLS